MLPISFFFRQVLAVRFFTSIMRRNLPGEIMENNAYFRQAKIRVQLPEGSQQPLFFPQLNRSFNAPQ
ncbi:conserved hypothetical protein [Photorhabdus asymbiotica]|uniref:Uncharacterized protein n=1 Tax=Photorhabdus asymbiotica subsp. asymbiotica (strain ATCC 43949 / 3105-77) TaxID=553480 RepID=C7BP60_PHOAA|nr:conserved hypothetical protein [Photorhabdus asymbiotica]